jgi:hypothetical protein
MGLRVIGCYLLTWKIQYQGLLIDGTGVSAVETLSCSLQQQGSSSRGPGAGSTMASYLEACPSQIRGCQRL